jgi:hypothetical protein
LLNRATFYWSACTSQEYVWSALCVLRVYIISFFLLFDIVLLRIIPTISFFILIVFHLDIFVIICTYFFAKPEKTVYEVLEGDEIVIPLTTSVPVECIGSSAISCHNQINWHFPVIGGKCDTSFLRIKYHILLLYVVYTLLIHITTQWLVCSPGVWRIVHSIRVVVNHRRYCDMRCSYIARLHKCHSQSITTVNMHVNVKIP